MANLTDTSFEISRIRISTAHVCQSGLPFVSTGDIRQTQMSHKQRKFVGESPVKLTFMIKQRALFFSVTLSLLMMCDRTQMDKKNENQNLIRLLRVKEGSKYNYTKW